MSGRWSGMMRLALSKARMGHGRTGPNPMVGAVVCRDGRVISTGYHERVGGCHAEVHALDAAGPDAEGADLVVTLEPCTRYGRTPPCVERILRSRVRRVVVGCLDPHPMERGRGIGLLRERGLEVEVGEEEEACRRLNEAYFKYIVRSVPFVTVKLACSLDGRIATRIGDSRWLSGPGTLRFGHRLRRDSGAVLVGGGTVRNDDPALTVREARPVTHPLRVVVSSRLGLPLDRALFMDQERNPTVVFTTAARPAAAAAALAERGVRVEEVEPDGDGSVSLGAVLSALGRMEVSRLLVEGGGSVAGRLVEAGLVDRLVLAYSPVVVGAAGISGIAVPGPDRLSDAVRGRVERAWRIEDNWVVSVRLGPDYCGEGM